MRSWRSMVRLPRWRTRSSRIGWESRLLRVDLVELGALDRFDQDTASVGRVTPLAHPHPLVDLEVLIVGEEMLDLLKHDRRQVLPLSDIRIIREGRVDGHADELLVTPMLVLEVEDPDRASADDAAWHER